MPELERPYFIASQPLYSPHIGALVQMMAYARSTTLQAVQDITAEDLDTIPAGFSNSVGMLLAHISATERIYQAASFENRDAFEAPDYAPYVGAMTFGEEGEKVQGRTLKSLLTELEETRAHTLSLLAERDDDWLASALTAPNFENMNHHWAWFHVMEDEVSHRGQIRILRKALKQSSSSG